MKINNTITTMADKAYCCARSKKIYAHNTPIENSSEFEYFVRASIFLRSELFWTSYIIYVKAIKSETLSFCLLIGLRNFAYPNWSGKRLLLSLIRQYITMYTVL